MSTTTTAVIRVDITAVGVATVTGPGFGAHVARIAGPRSSTNQPTRRIYVDDNANSGGDNDGRAPMPRKELALRKGFPAGAIGLARDLARHYGITAPAFELHDETGTYTLPEV